MGVSGREEPALSVAEKFLSDYTDDIKISNGSLMAVCGNKNSDKTILLDAHIDRIGFMVTEINENGFVKFLRAEELTQELLPILCFVCRTILM